MVESIIRNKVRAGLFTEEELVTSTFQKHIAPFKQHNGGRAGPGRGRLAGVQRGNRG